MTTTTDMTHLNELRAFAEEHGAEELEPGAFIFTGVEVLIDGRGNRRWLDVDLELPTGASLYFELDLSSVSLAPPLPPLTRGHSEPPAGQPEA